MGGRTTATRKNTERREDGIRLQVLEDHYGARWPMGPPKAHVEELTRRSVKRTINQLVEEVIWCEGHLAAG